MGGDLPEERAFFEAMRHVHEVMTAPNTQPGIEEKRREAMEQMEKARIKMEEARKRQGQDSAPGLPFGPRSNNSFGPPVASPSPP
jgi:hypothetical protein